MVGLGGERTDHSSVDPPMGHQLCRRPLRPKLAGPIVEKLTVEHSNRRVWPGVSKDSHRTRRKRRLSLGIAERLEIALRAF
jgi:hypothetical protein